MGERAWLGALVVVALFASITASLLAGAPVDLPGVALGSVVLLHAERAAALFAAILLALIVVSRAVAGELPYEISGRGVKYEERHAVDRVGERLEAATSDLRQGERDLWAAVAALQARLGETHEER